MPRRVLVHRPHESFDLVEVPAPNERSLQAVIKVNPQLSPSDNLGLYGDVLVVVGRRCLRQARSTSCAWPAQATLCVRLV